MEIVEKLIVWAGTPWGKVCIQALGVFVFCEFCIRMPLIKGLKIFTSVTKIKREFIGNYVSMLFNFIVGIIAAMTIHFGEPTLHIIYQSWYLIILSIMAHVLYIRYFDKYVKKKLGID